MLPTSLVDAVPVAQPASRTADLIAAFFAGRSPSTIAAYRGDLDDFRAFVGADTVEAAAARLLGGTNGEANGLALAWRACMIEGGKAPATVNRRLSALRALVTLGRTLGLIVWRLDVRSTATQSYRDTRGPARSGVIALLAAAAAQSDRRKSLRDVALIRLLYDTALRRGEVCKLDVVDADLVGSRVMVLGKGKREKVAITLPEPTRAALAAWVAERRLQAGPIFTALDSWSGTRPGQRLTGAGLWHIVRSLGRAAGRKTRPHGLRHAAITAALDATKGDVRAVQHFSSHAS